MIYLSIAIMLLAYIIGSIPFGLIVGKVFYRTDIREHGSKNIGATNAYRTLGAAAGAAVLIADLLKGFIPVLAVKYAIPLNQDLIPIVSLLAGVSAILGHCYSIFLGFSGGKAMSTAGGFVLALWPTVGIILLATWPVLLVTTRYSSVSSITLAIMLPILVSIIYPKTEYIIFSILVAVVLIYRHRSNIARLLAGKELKLGEKASVEED